MKASIKASAEGITAAAAEIRLVEILLWGGHVQQAHERLQKISGIDPNSPYLARVLNLLDRVKPGEPGAFRPTMTVVPPDQ